MGKSDETLLAFLITALVAMLIFIFLGNGSRTTH